MTRAEAADYMQASEHLLAFVQLYPYMPATTATLCRQAAHSLSWQVRWEEAHGGITP